ncbi:MAG: hypothetical protein WBC04_02245 [Candidatus Acidiferrales bacterium]
MRRRTYFVLLCLVLGFAGSARAQDTAAKIVDQYIKAAGGSKALSRIRTVSLEGAATRAGGASGTYTLDTKLPNRYYSELILGEKRLIEAYNGKSAWRQDASGEIATLLGPESIQLQAMAQIANTHLRDLKRNKLAITLVGHAPVRGKDAWQVEVSAMNGVKHEIFFDPVTHLIVKEAAPFAGVNEEIFYDDYRPESGVRLPRKIELRRGTDTYSIDITQAVVNGAIGERVFDLPVKSQVHLPDLKALFKEIAANQKAIDKIKENYAGTRTEDETEYEGNGKVTKRHENEYTFFYLDGEEISMLAKKGGKPLSEAEQRKETEKAQKRVEEIQKREAKKDAKEEKAKAEGKEDKEDKEEEVDIEMFLRACQFVNPRRERFRGQDVLVFDFEANPEYKPRKLLEKIVQKLAGVIWIDEKAHDVARLEAYFVNDAKIAGGLLATVHQGTGFVFEQAFINNEVWLPTYEEAHGSARVLLVKGFRASEVTRYSDYKKFRVETLKTIGAPKQP